MLEYLRKRNKPLEKDWGILRNKKQNDRKGLEHLRKGANRSKETRVLEYLRKGTNRSKGTGVF